MLERVRKRMSWPIADHTAYIPIKVHNTVFGKTFPDGDELLLAVLDTGFSGFVLVPPSIFNGIRLNEMKLLRTRGILADGRSLRLRGAYGSISIPELDFFEDGLIETAPGILETIIGMEALRKLRLELDGCSDALKAYKC